MSSEQTGPSQTAAQAAGFRADSRVVPRVNGEMAVVLGWGRAILMQLAHPLVAAGVAEHSDFRASPLASLWRLQHTLRAMLALTFGTEPSARRAAAGINAIHDRVHGTLGQSTRRFPVGTRYSAHDPELLRWVHATLLDSMPLAYELFVAPLSHEDRDRYCAEAESIAPMLGIPDRFLPISVAERDRYLEDMMSSGAIEVTATARTLAQAVLYPAWAPAAWPAFRVIRLVALGRLPPVLREGYGFHWNARHERALGRWCRGLRALHGGLPGMMTRWPAAWSGAR